MNIAELSRPNAFVTNMIAILNGSKLTEGINNDKKWFHSFCDQDVRE